MHTIAYFVEILVLEDVLNEEDYLYDKNLRESC